MKDVWELPALGAADAQRLGYPTQKPESLLERILRASSNEGQVVLDPFCGSGATLAVAQRLGRGWIGIENHYLGIAYQRYRLACAFPELKYAFLGGPQTPEEARQLALSDPAQFRWWTLALLRARPVGAEDYRSGTDTVHGVLPARSANSLPSLVLVALERVELQALHRFAELCKDGRAARVLVITLDDSLAAEICAAAAHILSPALEICTVADVLSSPNAFSF
jgi:hypothetical protein